MNEPDLEDMHPFSEPDGRILLSEQDYTKFVAMFHSRKPPTHELREAIAEYQRLKAAYPDANL